VGRKQLSPLEKAIRHALRARRRYREIQEEYVQALGIDPGDAPELAAGKRAVAEARMAHARAIEEHRRSAKSAASHKISQEAKDYERRHRSELHAQPPLGHSVRSWLSLPEEQAKRPVGKQPIPIDLVLHRAELEWNEAMGSVQEEAEKAGLWPLDIDSYRDPTKGRAIGRPPLDYLGELDAKIRLFERRINEFKTLPEEAFKWSGMGRKPIPREKRIQAYVERIEALEAEISERTEQLSPNDALHRQRKVLRDALRALDQGLPNRDAPEVLDREELLSQIERVEMAILKASEAKNPVE
jgi:hypothetical protein